MEELRPTLSGEDVTLRVLELSDAAAWLDGEDEEQLRWFELPAATLDDVLGAIERWRANWAQAGPVRHWGIWANGGADLAGGVQLRVRGDERASLSYTVFPAFTRQGLGTAAARLAARWGLENLSVDAIVAIVDERNLPSRRVAVAAGFALEGPAEPWGYSESGVMLRYVFPASIGGVHRGH